MEKVAIAISCIAEVFGNGLEKLMHPISVDRVPSSSWKSNQLTKTWLPESVMTVCPHCNQPSSLVTTHEGFTTGAAGQVVRMKGRCTQCDGISTLWVVNPESIDNGKRKAESIWMLPIPEGQRKPIELPENSVPDRLLRTYKAAVDCFNARIWSSTINECGRVIEGLTSDHFKADERKALGKLVQEAGKDPSSIEAKLFNPVLKLSSAVRLSRRTGSHYNFAEDPDADLASKVLTLTEYALEYFYGLPYRVDAIKEAVEKLEMDEE